MAAARKLQSEIDRTLKKINEGNEAFDEIWEKVYSAVSAMIWTAGAGAGADPSTEAEAEAEAEAGAGQRGGIVYTACSRPWCTVVHPPVLA
jgi:hypothetical protein